MNRLFLLGLALIVSSPLAAAERWRCNSTIIAGPAKGQSDKSEIEIDHGIFRWRVLGAAEGATITEDHISAETDAFVVGSADANSRAVTGYGPLPRAVSVLDKRSGNLRVGTPDIGDKPGTQILEGQCERVSSQ